eukprot:2792097-Amphidinium_carterae.1
MASKLNVEINNHIMSWSWQLAISAATLAQYHLHFSTQHYIAAPIIPKTQRSDAKEPPTVEFHMPLAHTINCHFLIAVSVGSLQLSSTWHKGYRFVSESRCEAIITQNVDGMHTAAGSKDVIELHGSETAGWLPAEISVSGLHISRSQCFSCVSGKCLMRKCFGALGGWMRMALPRVLLQAYRHANAGPRVPECHDPGIVMFGS